MSTFDATGGAHAAGTQYPNFPTEGDVGVDAPPLPAPEPAFDAFESLREQLAERDDEAERTTEVEIPGVDWRLVCAIDFEYKTYKEWQKAALPRNQRNGRKVNVLDMDQAMLSYLVLLNTCEGIEYQRSGDAWEPLIEDGGSPATLQSGKLMDLYRIVDPRVLVKKLFHTDAALIRAGAKVITAAGYGAADEAGDAEDPTD